MCFKMSRKYKESTPIDTVQQIRTILHQIGMMPTEQSWCNPKRNLFSVRLENEVSEGHFGTNGKGRNRQFALASAYGEFIERIQNGFIAGFEGLNRTIFRRVKEKCGFYYFPDEKIMSLDEFANLPNDYLNDIYGNSSPEEIELFKDRYFSRLNENGQSGVISVPFYDYRNKSEIYLPFNLTWLMTGSNGMAAGNTSFECIYQALCELVERYAARIVYFDKLTPPTVCDSFLSQFSEEYNIIKEIESSGLCVIVKDFSCGLSLPAVGVIIKDKTNTKYRLNIGSDTDFRIALSRALTEIYQGIKDDCTFDSILLDIPKEEQDWFKYDSDKDLDRRQIEIQKFIINGMGQFPKNLFDDIPSYSFSLKSFSPLDSYELDAKRLIDIFINQGFSVYLRNVSFLGFPSWYIYITNVSLWGRKSADRRPTTHSLLNLYYS